MKVSEAGFTRHRFPIHPVNNKNKEGMVKIFNFLGSKDVYFDNSNSAKVIISIKYKEDER